jgi:hypothetical protein
MGRICFKQNLLDSETIGPTKPNGRRIVSFGNFLAIAMELVDWPPIVIASQRGIWVAVSVTIR